LHNNTRSGTSILGRGRRHRTARSNERRPAPVSRAASAVPPQVRRECSDAPRRSARCARICTGLRRGDSVERCMRSGGGRAAWCVGRAPAHVPCVPQRLPSRARNGAVRPRPLLALLAPARAEGAPAAAARLAAPALRERRAPGWRAARSDAHERALPRVRRVGGRSGYASCLVAAACERWEWRRQQRPCACVAPAGCRAAVTCCAPRARKGSA
jgi:hypothetical protein